MATCPLHRWNEPCHTCAQAIRHGANRQIDRYLLGYTGTSHAPSRKPIAITTVSRRWNGLFPRSASTLAAANESYSDIGSMDTVPITLTRQRGLSSSVCACGVGYTAVGDDIPAAEDEFKRHLEECPHAAIREVT